MSQVKYSKTGYLHNDFKIFHLADHGQIDVDFHFHDFHKILICLKGNVSYCIEGRTFDLQEHDIVFVPAGDVHRPIVHDHKLYERIIIYISPAFLAQYSKNQHDLSLCFQQAHDRQSHVLRVHSYPTSTIATIISEMEKALEADAYANEVYHTALFLQLLVQLNRAALDDQITYLGTTPSNEKILAVLEYLNQHLTDSISIDMLAERFFLSRYHLMHAFKEETGYTIGNYLNTKRLLLAKELIQNGTPITEAALECGYKNYTTFSRAYKKSFGHAPSEG